mmetsp:Transcript_147399/g.274727  ORF Transcript_147399/g.274727 Transcript_147399/m.274727 type:complete len:607 (+) Transcript_147399:91-1911(+)
MPSGPRRTRPKGGCALPPGQQTLKLWKQPGQGASSTTTTPETSRDLAAQVGEVRGTLKTDNGLEDSFGRKRKAEAGADLGAGADIPGSSPKKLPRSAALHAEDGMAKTPKVSNLRERIAAKKGASAASPLEVETANSSTGSAGSVEHKELGGLSLRWRLLMTQNAATQKEPRAALATRSLSSSSPILPTLATPCRSEQAPPEEASPKPHAQLSECGMQAEDQLPEPATPSPSERAAPHETPTPPQSQSGGSSSRRDSFDAEHRQRSPGGLSDSPTSNLDGSKYTVKELKSRLKAHRIDTADCVEKRDLQVLWDKFQRLREEPIEELRRRCALKGCGQAKAGADECAKLLLEAEQRGRSSAKAARHEEPRPEVSTPPAAEPSRCAPAPPSTSSARVDDASLRCRTATAEANRILALKQRTFRTRAAWGFAVLGADCKTAQAVSRAFRALMLKLHPDRAGGCARVAEALEILREAKECCERAVSLRDPPPAPRRPSARVLCSTPGRRQIKLDWLAPEVREEAPVRRYIVAAFDPSYGRAITVAVLEPDYSEELGRFVPVEELLSYTLHERNLQKVPVFRQAQVKLQVAAANEAGQSPWATVTVPFRAA